MWVAAGLAALEVANGLNQADLIQRQGAIQLQISKMNAGLAMQDAANAERTGETEVARYQDTINKAVSSQRVGFASEGVDVNYGTAAEVQADSKVAGMLNQIDLQNQARARAMGFIRQSRQDILNGYLGNIQNNQAARGVQNAALLSGANALTQGYPAHKGTKDQQPDGFIGDSQSISDSGNYGGFEGVV